MRQLRRISDAWLATIFPTPCQTCHQLVEASADGIVCQTCWNKSCPFDPAQTCRRCGYPAIIAPGYPPPADCVRCRALIFTSARACGPYQGALRATILYLKRRPYICPTLLARLNETLASEPALTACDRIIPVPLHAQRRRERGYNQAQIIADRLARLIDKPVDSESLERRRATVRHRAGLDIIDRQASLNNAFAVTRPRLIEGQALLLVDDLFTTGSTISACAATLLAAGARRVDVLTIARVIF
jgi:ComF family protein